MLVAAGKSAAWAKDGAMALAGGKTLGYGRVALSSGELCTIYVSSTKSPSDADWSEYIAWFRKTVKPGDRLKSVVYERSAGHGPNAAQRQQLNEMTAPCSLHVAVLSPSAVGRGIVTAMNWFKKDSYRAFLPVQLDEAIDYLQLGPQAAEVRGVIREMMRELDKHAGVPPPR